MIKKNNKGFTLNELLVSIVIILILTFIAAPKGCTISSNYSKNEPDIIRHLRVDGYENIKIIKYSKYGCGLGDMYGYHFEAMKNKNFVSGIVCGGYSRAWAIRVF